MTETDDDCPLTELNPFSIPPKEGVNCPFCGSDAVRLETTGEYACIESERSFWIEL